MNVLRKGLLAAALPVVAGVAAAGAAGNGAAAKPENARRNASICRGFSLSLAKHHADGARE